MPASRVLTPAAAVQAPTKPSNRGCMTTPGGQPAADPAAAF